MCEKNYTKKKQFEEIISDLPKESKLDPADQKSNRLVKNEDKKEFKKLSH